MEKEKCGWGSGCGKDAEYREIVRGRNGEKVTWMFLCAAHHNQLGEVPIDYEKIEETQ